MTVCMDLSIFKFVQSHGGVGEGKSNTLTHTLKTFRRTHEEENVFPKIRAQINKNEMDEEKNKIELNSNKIEINIAIHLIAAIFFFFN